MLDVIIGEYPIFFSVHSISDIVWLVKPVLRRIRAGISHDFEMINAEIGLTFRNPYNTGCSINLCLPTNTCLSFTFRLPAHFQLLCSVPVELSAKDIQYFF